MIERIRELCREKGTNFSQLEKTLGFANGSLAKTKPETIQAHRVLQLASYFNVSMEYLMTGENRPQVSDISDFEHKIILQYRKLSSRQQDLILEDLNLSKKASSLSLNA